MNLERFETSPRRMVGQWLLIPSLARYECHYGVFIYGDGSASLYDIFSHRGLHHEDDPNLWPYEFWIRETLDELLVGEDAERVCRYSRNIVLPRTMVEWILRANRKHRYSVEDIQEGDVLSRLINDKLEQLFWNEIAPYLTYQPLRRVNITDPDEPFPTHSGEALLNWPVDLPTPQSVP